MEYHQQQLQNHCRVCGNRLRKGKKSQAPVYCCTKLKEELLSTFEVDIDGDDALIHPAKVCNPCYVVMKRDKQARTEELPYTHSTTVMIWTPHADSSSCLVSLHIHYTHTLSSHTKSSYRYVSISRGYLVVVEQTGR